MPVTIKNVGTGNGYDTTNPYNSTIRVIGPDKFEIVIGPNATRGFSDPTNAFTVLAATSTASVGFQTTKKGSSQHKDGANTET